MDDQKMNDLILNAVEEKGGITVVFSAVTSLAGLLHDKGLINYDEFAIAFLENLEDKG
ncbi:hypothetical protein MKZ08_16390 [Viridibacillus sp. FSL R5-0477]|uniref:hypothetical protein n=1 Tax=Viridibacillus TaxID=496496 RepID=UPI0004B25D6B|nr:MULTISPECIES: hypothetical protein [Viridibacillus]